MDCVIKYVFFYICKIHYKWRKGLCWCDEVKDFDMRRLSSITGWVLDAIISVLVRERQGEIWPRDRRGGGNVTERQRLEWCSHKSKNANSHHWPKTQGTDSLEAPEVLYLDFSPVILRTFGLQPSERIHFRISATVFVVICHSSHRNLIQYSFATVSFPSTSPLEWNHLLHVVHHRAGGGRGRSSLPEPISRQGWLSGTWHSKVEPWSYFFCRSKFYWQHSPLCWKKTQCPQVI